MLRILYHTYNEEAIRWTALTIFVITTFVSITFSFLSGLVLLFCYCIGFIACWLFLQNQSKISTFFKNLGSFYDEEDSQSDQSSKSCTVCNSSSCKRQHHRSNPLKNLRTSEDLNIAIEEFYSKILDNYVLLWYQSFSSDVSFPGELKICLRHTTATLLSKCLEFDVTKVITTKLLPCAIKHVDDYMSIKQIAKIRNSKVNEIAVDYFGKKLHIAATNRQNELNYLRSLTSCLIPHLVQENCFNCKNFSVVVREIVTIWVLLPLMDFLANPHMINLLIILAYTHKNKWQKIPLQPTEKVEFMPNFKRKYTPNSSFTCTLKDILKSTELLYVFMQFLKNEGSVHLLQFCLDIEEFNDKLLNPDLTKKELELIHESAQNLYKIYFNPESSEFIECPQEIIKDFKQLLQKGIYNIVKLRTSEPLYQAYDFTYSHLETEWLPLFFHSNEFYQHICGTKLTPSFSKSSVIRSQRKYDSANTKGSSKFSSSIGKIRTALKPNQTVDGALYPQEHQIFGEKTAAYVEDVLLSDHTAATFRDLNLWKVSINSVDSQQISSSKQIHFFNIHVQCTDNSYAAEVQQWTVRRKDEDFYNLKSKLVEFHGETEICNSPLPTRRFAIPTETRKQKYEFFLKSLLQKPNLRGSDLLHTFLTTEQDFTLILNTTSNFPFVDDIGSIYQTFAFKIRKERGQHLDSFITSFLNSTGYSKSKFEWGEVGDEVYDNLSKISEPKPINSSLFKNNFNLLDRVLKESSCTSFNPNGLTESMFYLFKHVFKVPQSVLKLYVAFCIVSQTTTEAVFQSFVDYKIKNLLCESNIIHLIHILQDVIFEHHPPQTEEELKMRKKMAFEELEKSVPKIAQLILGKNFLSGLRNLFDMLQNPLCNKQLSYNLLDIIVLEMFPTLEST